MLPIEKALLERDDLLDGQFVVATSPRPPRRGLMAVPLESLQIEVPPGLPLIAVRDRNRKLVGYFVGEVIDLRAVALVKDAISLDASFDGENFDDIVEREIYRFSGSFLFIVAAGGKKRIYLDADGSRSLVYDPVGKIAGATAASLLEPDDYLFRFRPDLYAAFGVARDGWFTAGLTAHDGVRRLMCNHYLDLDSWSVVRHWPREPHAISRDPESEMRTIIDSTRRGLYALAKEGEIYLALTAGNETRLLLALCRDILDSVTFVTVRAPGANLDIARAKELARRFGLRHVLLDYREADEAKAKAWQARTGHTVSGANMTMHPSVAPLDGKIFVGGLGGEIGRGFLWLQSESRSTITTDLIVSRLKLPPHPSILREVGCWFAPLEGSDSLHILDLAYLELRMSCWAFAQSYANPAQREIHPLISRQAYAAMMSLPTDFRRGGGAIRQMIRDEWPDLLSLPVNKFGDWRDTLRLLRHALARPDRAAAKVKQLLRRSA